MHDGQSGQELQQSLGNPKFFDNSSKAFNFQVLKYSENKYKYVF